MYDKYLKPLVIEFIHSQARVCSEHFRPEDYKNWGQYHAGLADKLLLQPDAVPSIFADAETPPSLPPSAKSPTASAKKRSERQQSRELKKVLTKLEMLSFLFFLTT